MYKVHYIKKNSESRVEMRDTTRGKKYILNYEELKAGDIILESGKEAHSKVIQLKTKSNFSHAMICVEKMSIIHAEIEGIFSKNPQRLLVEEKTDLKVFRIRETLSDDEVKKLEVFLRTKIGSLYSIKEALRVELGSKQNNANNELQFCSRLVSQAYECIGLKLVDNIDFCSPGDIERSPLLKEVTNIVRNATKEDIAFASTKNYIRENQISTYEWLNKTRNLAAAKYDYHVIYTQHDVMLFLNKFPQADCQVCEFIQQSGYLKNFEIEMRNNPHMFEFLLFVSKFKDIDNIKNAMAHEFNNTISSRDRHIKDLASARENYVFNQLEYHRLNVCLMEDLLGVILSKYETLIKVCDYVLRESLASNIDINTFMFMQRLDFETKKLKNLEIRPYQVS